MRRTKAKIEEERWFLMEQYMRLTMELRDLRRQFRQPGVVELPSFGVVFGERGPEWYRPEAEGAD